VGLFSFDELLADLAERCEDFSGAALAGVARAAASHALERAVNAFSEHMVDQSKTASAILDCLVTPDDFISAVADVLKSMGESDFTEEEAENKDDGTETKSVNQGDSGDNIYSSAA
jgi:SpoVK/Ycf46/Vps4 family AAA+-type ATPase